MVVVVAATEADAAIPDNAPWADTARAGLWEVTGIGLMKLNDIEGATTAFRRFEIDYSNPAYPRPDFDALYNLTRLSLQVGDHDLAARIYAAQGDFKQTDAWLAKAGGEVRIPEERLDPRQAGITLEQLAGLIDEAVASRTVPDAAPG